MLGEATCRLGPAAALDDRDAVRIGCDPMPVKRATAGLEPGFDAAPRTGWPHSCRSTSLGSVRHRAPATG